jgi:hypothetical protein
MTSKLQAAPLHRASGSGKISELLPLKMRNEQCFPLCFCPSPRIQRSVPIFESHQTCLCLHLSLLLVGSMASSIKSALFCVLLLCTFLFSSLTVCLDPLKDEKLQWAMKHLQGFNWTATFTTEGCSIAQAHALVGAARVGVQDMLSYAAKYKVDNNADWNRFFMNDGEAD